MLDEQTNLLLQIELNTISSSFPGLSCLVSELHRLFQSIFLRPLGTSVCLYELIFWILLIIWVYTDFYFKNIILACTVSWVYMLFFYYCLTILTIIDSNITPVPFGLVNLKAVRSHPHSRIYIYGVDQARIYLIGSKGTCR